MIIKSHVRGDYRSAADYLNSQGENEKIRTLEISDIDAKNLEEAFHNMWVVASSTKASKPLHHISINPFKDERLTDDQVIKIAERCEQKYGYKLHDHQRVIVEHVKGGRQHFHVFWNRVSLTTNRPIWPGHHWNKSRQASREMEKELGLKRTISRRMKRVLAVISHTGRASKILGRYSELKAAAPPKLSRPHTSLMVPPRPMFRPVMWMLTGKRRKKSANGLDFKKPPIPNPKDDALELLMWAWEHKRIDILQQFGIHLPPDYEF